MIPVCRQKLSRVSSKTTLSNTVMAIVDRALMPILWLTVKLMCTERLWITDVTNKATTMIAAHHRCTSSLLLLCTISTKDFTQYTCTDQRFHPVKHFVMVGSLMNYEKFPNSFRFSICTERLWRDHRSNHQCRSSSVLLLCRISSKSFTQYTCTNQ